MAHAQACPWRALPYYSVPWENAHRTGFCRENTVHLQTKTAFLLVIGFVVGDRVRVKTTVKEPKHKWGNVTHSSVGVVTGEADGIQIVLSNCHALLSLMKAEFWWW